MKKIKLISPIINVGEDFFIGEYQLDDLSSSRLTVIKNELHPRKTVYTNLNRLRIHQEECIITDGHKNQFYFRDDIEKFISDKMNESDDVVCLNGNIIYQTNSNIHPTTNIVDFFHEANEESPLRDLIKAHLTWAYRVKQELLNIDDQPILSISI